MEDTFVKLLAYNNTHWGEMVAWRRKRYGIWEEYTWREIYENVKALSLGLTSIGLEKNEVISIAGDSDLEWFWAELAVQALGAKVAGLPADGSPYEDKYIIEHSDSRMVIAQDQEQVDKILEIKNELSLVRKVIYWNPKGLSTYRDPILISFEEVVLHGREFERKNPGFFEKTLKEGSASDVALFFYTSGTSGIKKAAMISYDMMLNCAKASYQVFSIKSGDKYLSFIRPDWIVEQIIGLAYSLLFRTQMNFPEDRETVKENLVELSPQLLILPVPLWQDISSEIQVGINKTTLLKRLISKFCFRIGQKIIDFEFEGHKLGLIWKFLSFLANNLFFRPLRSKHGLHRLKTALATASLMAFDMYRFFYSIGVKLRIAYCITEAGIVTVQRETDPVIGSVGAPIDGVEIKVSDYGEILVHRNTCCGGYYKDAESTEKNFTGDWFCTGDAGYIDDEGNLIYIDRLPDVKALTSDIKFSPQFIEVSLKFSPYIKEAIVVEDPKGKYLAAIISIDFISVGDWAEKHHIPYINFTDLSQKPEVINLLKQEIRSINNRLPQGIAIQKFISFHKEIGLDEAGLTRTTKLQRDLLEKRYGELLSAVLEDKLEIVTNAQVAYRDNSKDVTPTSVKINTVE